MTKEEKSKDYVSCFYTSQQHPTQAMQTAFLDGYRAAEQSSEEMMCRFAEWVYTKKVFESGGVRYTAKEMPELLTEFKQSQKK